jgi:hypothetical protein
MSAFIRIAITVFWLAMCGWLLSSIPWHSKSVINYRNLLRDGTMIRDSYMKISLNDKAIGFSNSRVDVNERNPRLHYLMENTVEMVMNVMGIPQRIHTRSKAFLDKDYQLQVFSFNLESDVYSTEIRGEKASGETFNVTIGTGKSKNELTARIPHDAIVYSPMGEMALKELAPGETLTMPTFNPLTMSTDKILIKALERESITIGTNTIKTIKVSSSLNGEQVFSWVNKNGQIIRQESPTGMVMEECTFREAMALDYNSGSQEDLLALLAVPSNGDIANPRELSELTLKLHGVELDAADLTNHRQTILEKHDDGLIMKIHTRPVEKPMHPDEQIIRKALASSPYIQSTHPSIRAQAQSITQGLTTKEQQAYAVNQWVYQNLTKVPTVSIPSALDVLQHRQGDCNEHTYLATALLRSIQIPCRIMVGVVHMKGAFYYHAWPSVYLDGWHDMDPTFGQNTADATHIALTMGELEDQAAIMRMIGKLKIDVIEEDSL